MQKALELVDVWMRSQNELVENWAKSQKELMDNWITATKIIHESVLKASGRPEGATNELFDLYQSAVTSLLDSSRVLADEAAKIQETWENAFEKQMAMNREMVKGFSELFKQAA